MASGHNDFVLYSLSEKAVTIEFGNMIMESLLEKVINMQHLLHEQPFPGMLTTVPAYTTLTVFFDPMKVMTASTMQGSGCFDRVSQYIGMLKPTISKGETRTSRTITIPVCYGGTFGPDLGYMAQLHGLSPEKIIQLHSSAAYKVYMIGFVPGFAYLGGLPEELITPRKPIPRSSVPAGAVGIAGRQTGIYPIEIPGGWQIIGQTPLTLFDARRKDALLLKAGDEVKFEAVSINEYQTYLNAPAI